MQRRSGDQAPSANADQLQALGPNMPIEGAAAQAGNLGCLSERIGKPFGLAVCGRVHRVVPAGPGLIATGEHGTGVAWTLSVGLVGYVFFQAVTFQLWRIHGPSAVLSRLSVLLAKPLDRLFRVVLIAAKAGGIDNVRNDLEAVGMGRDMMLWHWLNDAVDSALAPSH
jgi:hypothetical protein